MLPLLRAAATILLILSLFTGIAYPLAVTFVAQTAFSNQANGSLRVESGTAVGSRLLGQSHTAPEYFWGRPSATAPMPANGMASGGSNQGPTNPALLETVRDRCSRLREADPDNTEPIPVDLVTASASGLDPEISSAAALYQANRVARATGLSLKTVQQLIARHIEPPTLGFLGQPRVNVLELNLDLRRTREQPAN